jgi:signal transduction histidine kinase
MTFQRKLLLGFSLMVVPALLIAAEAIRTNMLERAALQTLGQNMAHSRTYSELENAMSNQSDVVWRYLTGMEPSARQEFDASNQVVDYWEQRWRADLRPDQIGLADSVHAIERQIQAVSLHVFALFDSGQHALAYQDARRSLRDQLFPLLAAVNREIYRRTRESSVQGAYAQLSDIVGRERRALFAILALSLATGLFASYLIANGLARPVRELSEAMAVVGAGDLDHPIRPPTTSRDEIGVLARAFAQMTDNLRRSRADLVRLNAELAAKVAQLERTQAQLVQSERLASIGEMAAAVAHGIRNPLASLRAAAQVAMRRTAEPEASREHLSAIIEEVDRLDRRVSHLLSFSRPAPYHPMRESAATLVEDLLPTFAELIREHHVVLELDLVPTLPPVRVDPMQVEQALVEIISNALDAMPPPDGGTLRISAHPDGTNGVVVEIADTGVGIPENVLPSVCEPFFTTRPEGTGLGLAISRRFVEQNGGRLQITSRRGVGTTVRVHLPAEKEEEAIA